jgi:hypothetical protein
VVECQLPKLDVVGSSPISRSNYCTSSMDFHALPHSLGVNSRSPGLRTTRLSATMIDNRE